MPEKKVKVAKTTAKKPAKKKRAQKKPAAKKPAARKKQAAGKRAAKKPAAGAKQKNVIFLTGFPGFIGKKLVKEIAAQEPQTDFIFLVQDRFIPDAGTEVEELKMDKQLKDSKMTILAGDISFERLGLTEKKYREIVSSVTDVFHLAAIYDLAVPEETARRVNVTGTKNIVDFSREAKKLKKFVYFSTCYVAGKRRGTALETELVMGQGFKNHYENTKNEAEIVVRNNWDKIPTIIIRPAIVVGDSITGETQKFDGPYFGMILVDTLKLLQIPLPNLGEGNVEINLVPIDFIVDATIAIWKKKGTEGTCFALADPSPVLVCKFYTEIIRLLGARGPFGQIPPILLDIPLRLPAVRKILGVPREFLEYFNHPVHYDCANTLAALEGTGIRCPNILDYLPTLIRFYRNNRHRSQLRWKAF